MGNSSAVPPLPPKRIRQAGRPPKARRRGLDEPVQSRKRKVRGRPPHLEAHKLKRNQETMSCGRCGERGHNKRSCLRREAQERPIEEDEGDEGLTQEQALMQADELDEQYLMEIDEIVRTHTASQPATQDAPEPAPELVPESAPKNAPDSVPQKNSGKGVKIRAPPTFVGGQPSIPDFPKSTQCIGQIVKKGGTKYLMLPNNEGRNQKGRKK